MAFRSDVLKVSVTPTLIGDPTAAHVNALIRNVGSRPVFVGDADITTSDGFPLEPGDVLHVAVGPGDSDLVIELYGLVSQGEGELRALWVE